MPRGDKSGPSGEGPNTGRGMGYCAGNDRPGFSNANIGRGGGYGRRFQGGAGFGRGMGFRFQGGYGNSFQEGTADVSEKTLIENDIRILQDQLSTLEDRLSKIEEK